MASTAARGIPSHQIIDTLHHAPGSPAAAGALVLIAAGVLLLAAAQLRRPALSPAAQLVEDAAREYGYPATPRRQCRAQLRRVK